MAVPVNPLDRDSLRTRVQTPRLSAFVDRQRPAASRCRPSWRRCRRAARVPGRRQAAAPGVLLLGLARGRRARPRRKRRHRPRRRLARAAPGLRADPRRRHGRQRHPPRQPAVHRRFAAVHREAALGGTRRRASAPRPRSCSATCAWSGATRCSRAAACPAERHRRGRPVFDVMRTEVMAGQYLDVLAQARGLDELERAARVRSRHPLQVRQVHDRAPAAPRRGAGRRRPGGRRRLLRLRPAARRGLPAARRRARRVRRPGGHRQAGRRRPARGQADPAGGAGRGARRQPGGDKTLRAGLGDPDLDEAGVAELQDIIRSTGALDDVEARIAALTDEARAALDAAPIDARGQGRARGAGGHGDRPQEVTGLL